LSSRGALFPNALFRLFILEDYFGAPLYCASDKRADAFADFVRSSSDYFVRWVIQVSGNPVGKSLSGSATFAPVSSLRHA
jgi:hypothetical protein